MHLQTHPLQLGLGLLLGDDKGTIIDLQQQLSLMQHLVLPDRVAGPRPLVTQAMGSGPAARGSGLSDRSLGHPGGFPRVRGEGVV